MEVERQRASISLSGFEGRLAADSKCEAWNTFNALVGGRNNVVDMSVLEINGNSAEGGHSIHNE